MEIPVHWLGLGLGRGLCPGDLGLVLSNEGRSPASLRLRGHREVFLSVDFSVSLFAGTGG